MFPEFLSCYSPVDVVSVQHEHRIDSELCHLGCLFELSQGGAIDVPIVGGRYLEDGDTVTLSAWAVGKNGVNIGFGDLVTVILPAVD